MLLVDQMPRKARKLVTLTRRVHVNRDRIGIGLAICLCVALIGCGDLPNITEKQGDMIAEYAGGVLLRYSGKYDLRLVKNDLDEDGIEDSVNGAASGAAAATEEPTATPESSPDTADATATPSDVSEEPQPTEEPTVSLNDLFGISGLDFKYKSSEFANGYPDSSDSVEITPEEGQVLYVVKFQIKNTGSKSKKVDLTSRALHYELDVGGEKFMPTISLLPNGGLNYLMTTIKPGQTEEAVLIFNLDKSKKGNKGNALTITEDDKTAKIDL